MANTCTHPGAAVSARKITGRCQRPTHAMQYSSWMFATRQGLQSAQSCENPMQISQKQFQDLGYRILVKCLYLDRYSDRRDVNLKLQSDVRQSIPLLRSSFPIQSGKFSYAQTVNIPSFKFLYLFKSFKKIIWMYAIFNYYILIFLKLQIYLMSLIFQSSWHYKNVRVKIKIQNLSLISNLSIINIKYKLKIRNSLL